MQRFIAIRVLQSLLAIWVMSLIVFGLARISGDPLDVMLPIEAMPEDYERLSKHWGLDKPVATQYVIFLKKAVQGDFGMSMKYQGQTAMGLVWERLPATLELAGFSLLVSALIALPIGVLAAVAKGSHWDTAAKIIALLGQSLPVFWLGIVLMWIFAVVLGWLPAHRPPLGDDALHGQRGRGHVPRENRREGENEGVVREAAASLHQGPLLGRPSVSPRHHARRDHSYRRSPLSHQSALGVPLPSPLPVRYAPVR